MINQKNNFDFKIKIEQLDIKTFKSKVIFKISKIKIILIIYLNYIKYF